MTTRDIVHIALFAALMAVLGVFPALNVPVINVPITAQSMGVMLAGGLLGARRGTLAILLFMVIVLAGLPLLSGGRGGIAVLAGPTVGFFLGWLPAAFVTGLVTERFLPRLHFVSAFLAAATGGILVLYACGIPGISVVTGAPLATAAWGSVAFLPGDLIKAALAAAVMVAVSNSYPLIGRRSARRIG
ncbi:biotin transporter BioY [Aureimonas jatrophae]|uniref:Biotin transporter n=1 Tax=Aureimonas jatrophae TaxID=1166073 RepID=A0A1H0CYA5_9HYPH|nr:biotin transporter BioY [Aureimonas jatrophae]MBB3949410.1 biotin transport system substrate-specific component [Aureimonas jatrophae]SDN62875.1 biotin transport system substrate-specific component [Aureimonas jatrophae]